MLKVIHMLSLVFYELRIQSVRPPSLLKYVDNNKINYT